MTKILGVVGSLREHSTTRRLVEATLAAVHDAGGEARLLDLRQFPLPLLNPDEEDFGPIFQQVHDVVVWADAFILGTPDYHGSMSGPMKNFLDYFWHEFMGKLFGYIVASHEKGLTVQDHMRTVVRQCYGWSLPYGIGTNGRQDFDADGNLVNQRLLERIQMLARDLIVYGQLIHGQFRSDLKAQPEIPGFARYFNL